jgi:hypothetical protein
MFGSLGAASAKVTVCQASCSDDKSHYRLQRLKTSL